MYWLQYERCMSCSPKSYALRLTTVKTLFLWLHSIGAVPFDPAAKLVHQKITSPMPKILQEDEVDRLLAVTEKHMNNSRKPDPRPHLLVNLLLQTGINKAECMRLTEDDFETSDPANPTVLIRYQDTRQLHKERRLPVSPELVDTVKRYVAIYKPTERLFECTPRNLEYVLTDAANAAQLPTGASLEMLRWTCAFRDLWDGMPNLKLQEKLGLSKVTFRETLKKLEKISKGETE